MDDPVDNFHSDEWRDPPADEFPSIPGEDLSTITEEGDGDQVVVHSRDSPSAWIRTTEQDLIDAES